MAIIWCLVHQPYTTPLQAHTLTRTRTRTLTRILSLPLPLAHSRIRTNSNSTSPTSRQPVCLPVSHHPIQPLYTHSTLLPRMDKLSARALPTLPVPSAS